LHIILCIFFQVRGVYIRSNDLITALSTEQRIDSDTLVVNIYSTQNTGNLSEERDSKNALFMYFQILIDILLQMTNDQNLRAKQELIDHFKRIYNENEVQQKLIQEFENDYQPEKAIWWYTRPTFLYNTLNKALRESDYEVLRALRFFINDLYRQLRYVYEKFLDVQNTNNDPVLKVYRGQSISIDDLRYIRENIGQYISIQNFLSTSIDRHVGLFFSHASEISPNTTRILFQFNIDTRMMNTKPYGNITSLSYFPDEQEVMIMLGSIFRIEQVDYDECEQTWIAILCLCTEDDYALKELMKQMKEETDGGITSLGWLLYNQGEYEKATNYFEQLLLESTIDDFDRGGCYRGLGAVQIALQNYDEALENFQKELDLLSEDDDEENIAETYAKIGEVYFFKKDYELALLYEQRAHDIFLRLNSLELSDVHRTIGNIYHAKQQFNLALEYYEKALEVDYQHQPENHYNFGITYECIGSNYHNSENYEKAMEYFLKAHANYLKSLPPKHSRILTLKTSINQTKTLM